MTRFLVIVFFTVVLIGCSSAPKNEKVESTASFETAQPQFVEKDSAYYVAKAQSMQAGQDQRGFFILAAKQAIAEQKPPLYIHAILNSIDINEYNSVRLDIELAKSLLFVEETNKAELVLRRLQQGSPAPHFDIDLRIIDIQLKSQQSQSLAVVKDIFRLQSLHESRIKSSDTRLIYSLLWQHILSVPTPTLQRFQYDFGESAQAWVALADIIKTELTDAVRLPNELQRWKNLYPNAVELNLLPEQIKSLLNVEPFSPSRIALLLPLSGKLSKQAELVRDGFLARYQFDASMQVNILDTGLLSLEEIEEQLTASQADFIVGPLQKEKIVEFENSDIIRGIAQLHLNTPEIMPNYVGLNSDSQDNPLTVGIAPKYYFSLAPEDEIEQAIEYFLEKGVKRPAVIYADNTLGKRLFERFNQAWSTATEQTVEAIAFRNKSKLGEAVQNLLDVTASEARIAEMKKLFGAQLEAEARSRTDIDAVYVIANDQQTRLIKPYFDVSISAFGQRLPIYASSRSYVVDESVSQMRDLNGLVFTEMPWLVRNTDPELQALYDKIGEQQTQLKKLFAFGFDAHQLIFALKQLAILPKQHMKGLTGALSVSEGNKIKRRLSWSRYQQGNVINEPEPKPTQR